MSKYSVQTLAHDLSAKKLHLEALLVGNRQYTPKQTLNEIDPFIADLSKMLRDYRTAQLSVNYEKAVESLSPTNLHNTAMACRDAIDCLNDVMALLASATDSTLKRFGADEGKGLIEDVRAFVADESIACRERKDTLEAPPPPPSTVAPSDTESEGWKEVIRKKTNGKRKKGEKAFGVRPVSLSGSHVPSAEELVYDRSLDTLEPVEEEWRWPSRVVRLGLVKVPEEHAPTLNGKRVRLHKLSPADRKKVVWELVAPATYYRLREMSPELISSFVDSGYIPRAIEADAIAKGVSKIGSLEVPKGYPETELGALDRDHVLAADMCYWWAQIEKLLHTTGLEAKAKYIDKWMWRLISLPDAVKDGIVDVAKQLYIFLKHNGGEAALVNKTFRGFATGMLATWKAGETRANYLKRAQPSVNVYWKDHAGRYATLWKTQPFNDFQVKPAVNSTAARLVRKAQAAAKSAAQALGATAAAGKKMAAETAEQIVQDAEEFQNATERLTLWQKAKVIASATGERFHAVLHRMSLAAREAKIVEGLPTGESGLLSKTVGAFMAIIGWPFAYVDDYTEVKNGVAHHGVKFFPRSWFAPYWNFFSYADENGPTADLVINKIPSTPVRIYARFVAGVIDVATRGPARLISRVGAIFNGYTETETEESLSQLPKPDYWRFFEGLVQATAYSLVSAAAVVKLGLPMATGALSFAAGWTAVDYAAKGVRGLFRKWREWRATQKSEDEAEEALLDKGKQREDADEIEAESQRVAAALMAAEDSPPQTPKQPALLFGNAGGGVEASASPTNAEAGPSALTLSFAP